MPCVRYSSAVAAGPVEDATISRSNVAGLSSPRGIDVTAHRRITDRRLLPCHLDARYNNVCVTRALCGCNACDTLTRNNFIYTPEKTLRKHPDPDHMIYDSMGVWCLDCQC